MFKVKFGSGISFLVLSLLLPLAAHAANIGVSVDEQIVVENVGDDMHVGDYYYAVDTEGIRRGIIEITSIDSSGARAKLLKGETLPGETLLLRPRQASHRRFTETIERKGETQQDADNVFHPTRKWHYAIGLTAFTVAGPSGALSPKYTYGYAFRFGRTMIQRSRWTLDLGVQFYTAGFAASAGPVSENLTFNYLGLLTTGGYAFVNDSNYQVRVRGGMMPSYLMGSKLVLSGVDSVTAASASVTNTKSDLSIVLGVELMTLQGWSADVLFDYGLLNIADVSTTSTKVTNQGLILSLGGSF